MQLKEQKKIVSREIGMRKIAYPKWVESAKITQEDADYQTHGMQEVLRSLDRLEALEELALELNTIFWEKVHIEGKEGYSPEDIRQDLKDQIDRKISEISGRGKQESLNLPE